MPPSAKCLQRIAPAAAMVDEFEWNTKNTNKTQLLASTYGTIWTLVVCENFNPKTDHLLSSSMQQVSCKCEIPWLEMESLAKFLAIKRCQRTKFGKVIKLAQSSIKNGRTSATKGVKLLKKIGWKSPMEWQCNTTSINQPSLCAQHNKQHQQHTYKNTNTVIPPDCQLSATSNKYVSAIARRRTVAHDLHNMAMQFFKVKLTHSLFY